VPTPPRYLPARALPPYAYVPGGPHPHPVRDPGGHSPDLPEPAPFDPAGWRDCEDYLWAADLYNAGYPWEAHEVWEGLWRQADPGPDRELLQCLIQLAAAAVQLRRGAPAGAARVIARARDHLAAALPGPRLGLDLDALAATLDHFAAGRRCSRLPVLELT
jgi:uncharacterized protein